jgi:pimeloyl-[acyl-carrier protein] methyl ester esterase
VDTDILQSFAGDLRHDFKRTVQRFIAIQAMGSEHAQAMQRTLRERVFRHGDPQISALEGGLECLYKVNLRPRLNEIHCPTLFITGEHDTLFRLQAARQAAALIKDARLHIIKGAGHAPFISHPHEFVAQLKSFLNESSV